MTTRFREDSGAVAVIVAILLFVLIALSAFAVDAGYLYTVKRQLQTAADAAALAGCRVLADGGDEAAVLAESDEYAERNASSPGDELYMLDTAPETVVTADSVQITVEKDAPLFFARIFGGDSTIVQARSKARIAYLTGVTGIVPWGVPTIQATRVTARFPGGAEVPLTNAGGGRWEGTVPVPAGASTSGKLLTVIAYNDQTAYPDGTSDYPNGVPEPIQPAASVWVRQATDGIRNVYVDKPFVTSGVDTSVNLYVEANVRPEARFDGKKYNLAAVAGQPGLWRAALPVPADPGLLTKLPVDVSITGLSLTDAAVVVVRRSTYPVETVSLSRNVITAGVTPQSVVVSVQLTDYQYGINYELKVVGGGAEVGNFCALDLSTVKAPPNWKHPQHPSKFDVTTDPDYKPPVYYNYLEKPFGFLIDIGDTIWTETGGLSGPQTDKALDVRFGGDTRTLEQWEAAGRPPSGRVVFVPVLEKMQSVTGQTPMRVVNFAAFYVDPGSDIKKDTIRGRFIEYVLPSEAISDTQPNGFYIMTVRLVTPDGE
jgi:Flp pilus assembly protein TadG